MVGRGGAGALSRSLLVILAAIGAWFVFGTPAQTVAGWGWPADAAPWEKVDALYYPDRSNLAVHVATRGLRSVEACRAAVRFSASAASDPELRRGDYECAVGHIQTLGNGHDLYRLTVR